MLGLFCLLTNCGDTQNGANVTVNFNIIVNGDTPTVIGTECVNALAQAFRAISEKTTQVLPATAEQHVVQVAAVPVPEVVVPARTLEQQLAEFREAFRGEIRGMLTDALAQRDAQVVAPPVQIVVPVAVHEPANVQVAPAVAPQVADNIQPAEVAHDNACVEPAAQPNAAAR